MNKILKKEEVGAMLEGKTIAVLRGNILLCIAASHEGSNVAWNF